MKEEGKADELAQALLIDLAEASTQGLSDASETAEYFGCRKRCPGSGQHSFEGS